MLVLACYHSAIAILEPNSTQSAYPFPLLPPFHSSSPPPPLPSSTGRSQLPIHYLSPFLQLLHDPVPALIKGMGLLAHHPDQCFAGYIMRGIEFGSYHDSSCHLGLVLER